MELHDELLEISKVVFYAYVGIACMQDSWVMIVGGWARDALRALKVFSAAAREFRRRKMPHCFASRHQENQCILKKENTGEKSLVGFCT